MSVHYVVPSVPGVQLPSTQDVNLKKKLCLLTPIAVALLSVCTAIILFLVQTVGLSLPTAAGMVAVINPEKIREIRPGVSGSKHTTFMVEMVQNYSSWPVWITQL